VYQCQLIVPSLRGQLMSSSVRAAGWRPSVADWGGGMSVMLCRRSIGRYHGKWMSAYCISHHGTISSCQSAATFKIVKRCCSQVFSCKQRYIKYSEPLPLPLFSRYTRPIY